MQRGLVVVLGVVHGVGGDAVRVRFDDTDALLTLGQVGGFDAFDGGVPDGLELVGAHDAGNSNHGAVRVHFHAA